MVAARGTGLRGCLRQDYTYTLFCLAVVLRSPAGRGDGQYVLITTLPLACQTNLDGRALEGMKTQQLWLYRLLVSWFWELVYLGEA